MEKTLIVIFSDPKGGGEEALGRVFNALVTAYDLQERNANVKILFQGTGTRWVPIINDPKHLLNSLFKVVLDKVDGVCGGCADVFGATEEIEKTELPLIRTLNVPGTTGVTSLGEYIKEGYRIVSF